MTAVGKKLFLNLLVRVRRTVTPPRDALHRHLLPWIASMVGSEELVIHWAVLTTRSAAEQLPYHTGMQLVRMLLMVQR